MFGVPSPPRPLPFWLRSIQVLKGVWEKGLKQKSFLAPSFNWCCNNFFFWMEIQISVIFLSSALLCGRYLSGPCAMPNPRSI